MNPLHRRIAFAAAFARALIGEPKLLLIDECDADEPAFRIARETSAAPFLIATRDLDSYCAVADELILLDGGRIVQRGAPRAVIDQPASIETAAHRHTNLFEATITVLDPGLRQ